MRSLNRPGWLLVAVLSTVTNCGDSSTKTAPTGQSHSANKIPVQSTPTVVQAQPFLSLLDAIQRSDPALMQRCFSGAIRKRLSVRPWKVTLADYKNVFAKSFGNWKSAEFSFRYEGGPRKGLLHVMHPRVSKLLSPMKVFREDGQWKLDER